MRVVLLPTFCMVAAAPLLVASCGPACRDVETRALPVECEDVSQFRGEIHLDSRALFDSFLRDQCIPSAPDAQVDDLLEAVDFDRDAVFVVSRPRDEQPPRCVVGREAERVQVCEDGLRVTFLDKLSDEPTCAGRWTVAFSLSRDDLRAALSPSP